VSRDGRGRVVKQAACSKISAWTGAFAFPGKRFTFAAPRRLTAAVGTGAASKENGDALYKPAQNKNNQRGAEAQDKRQQK
jgi:hypothetical protein